MCISFKNLIILYVIIIYICYIFLDNLVSLSLKYKYLMYI